MFRPIPTLVATVLWSTLFFTPDAWAQTRLNRAVIETARNRVQLLLANQSPRPARISDVVIPGNGVATARNSFAELRFNDGSLGRLGEQVVFWFATETRNFRLSNGTILLLIPPGQGRTHIRTPNAAAGIQGSALFVRYIAETDTTIVGALTTSGIEVFNRDGSQRQELQGGQMAVAVGDRIEHIYDFDLNTFYETSELVRGLAPTEGPEPGDGGTGDGAIAQVQTEMRTAVEQQVEQQIEQQVEQQATTMPAPEGMVTPTFIRLPESASEEFPAATFPPDPFPEPNTIDTGATPIEVQEPGGIAIEESPVLENGSDSRSLILIGDDRREPPNNDRPNPDRGNPGDRGGNQPGNEPPGRDDRRPNNDRPNQDDRRPGNDRPNRDDRPPGNNRPDRDRPGNDRPNRDDRPPGNNRPDRDRPGNNRPDRDDRQPGNNRPDRDERGSGNDRPNRDEREPEDRPNNDRPNRDEQEPGDRPNNDRPNRDEREPGDRPNNDRPNRDEREPGDRPNNDRPDRSDRDTDDDTNRPDIDDRDRDDESDDDD